MKLLWLSQLALLLGIAGCVAGGQGTAAGAQPESRPAAPDPAICAEPGTDGARDCRTSVEMLATPQLQEVVHDLRRLGLVTDIVEVGRGRVALTLGEEALAKYTPLAYHLERLYRAYRSAYDYGDIVVLELWQDSRDVGSYTSQGLLLR